MASDVVVDIEAQDVVPPPVKTNLLPVLIIPGFMSSGMEVQESAIGKSWVGKRVWINLSALGFESLHSGGALVQNEKKKEEEGSGKFDEKMHEEYKQELKCKSDWVQHISLLSDMIHERNGMKVRPIPGLPGVDYLTPGALMSLVSYVFGPVILALQKVGYTDENLDASSYDWRVPPCELEARDGYFTNTMRKVEELYETNNETPVVLLCHSLGCRTAHYFLNFCKQQVGGGQDWLDKYIHTYMPVGAPHLGAPKALRALVTGDKMGLDAFLTDEEGLVVGRSFGSAGWLLPAQVPAGAPAAAFLRRDGVLEITVSSMECSALFEGRGNGRPPKIRLVVTVNDCEMLKSEFQRSEGRNAVVSFPETFTFAVPLEKNKSGLDCNIQLTIQERGLQTSNKDQKVKRGLYYTCICAPIRAIVCLIKWILLFPCMILGKVWDCSVWSIIWGVDVTAKAAGASSTLAASSIKTLKLAKGKAGDKFNLAIVHMQEYQERACCSTRGISRRTQATVRVQWKPPKSETLMSGAPTCTVASPCDGSNQPHLCSKKDSAHYQSVRGDQLLQVEGLQGVLDLVDNAYKSDPVGPRTMSSTDAPPVKRVKAVYGINLPTEAGAIYRRENLIPKEGTIQALHTIDESAKLESKTSQCIVKRGIVFETKKSPQVLHDGENTTVHRCGDGTVPYWSLQHCRTWRGQCDVTVNELEGAEHREILADKRFHAVLTDYVTQGAVVTE